MEEKEETSLNDNYFFLQEVFCTICATSFEVSE